MSHLRTQEVLYESEAALRLVDHGLQGLRDDPAELAETETDGAPESSRLRAALAQANGELDHALDAIRHSREALVALSAAGSVTVAGSVAATVTATLAEATNALLASEQRLRTLAEQLESAEEPLS